MNEKRVLNQPGFVLAFRLLVALLASVPRWC